MFKIEMQEGSRWVRLGGTYQTKAAADQAIAKFMPAVTIRKRGVLFTTRAFRVVPA